MGLEEGLKKIYLSKSKTFLVFCFCFIFSVGIFSLFSLSATPVFYLYAPLVIILFLWWHFFSLGKFILGCLFCLWLAFYRVLIFMPGPDFVGQFWGQTRQFSAQVAAEPDYKITGVSYELGNIISEEKKYSGRILVYGSGVSDFKFGDILSVSCSLKEPENFSGFNYKKYLAAKNIYAVCYYPKWEKVGEKKTLFYYIYAFKDLIKLKMEKLFDEPYGSLLSGILYGARAGIPEYLAVDFRRVGLSHIVAVSGYNVSIIAAAIFSLFSRLGINRKKIFLPASILIFLFIIFSGASASVMRAGVVGIVVLAGRHLGRPGSSGRLLVAAAALLLLYNPLLLIYDAGFQLSFLAALGIIYLTPLFNRWWKKFIQIKRGFFLVGFFWEILAVTLAATIAVLPLLLYQFGEVSLVALPVNLLVLGLIPPVMFFGFLSIFLSWLWIAAAQILAWATQGLLYYIIRTTEFFAGLPYAMVTAGLSVFELFFIYSLMIYIIYNLWKKYEKDLLVADC